MTAAINREKAASFSGDKDQIKTAQKELKIIIKQSKFRYKESVEKQMSNCNTRGLWNSLKSLAGYGISKASICRPDLNVNEVNQFFQGSINLIFLSLMIGF